MLSDGADGEALCVQLGVFGGCGQCGAFGAFCGV